eukprot:GFYU01004538.1.p1 GENE.GFYU01004538.1~~GFYU01004538.1.p1  ORF type:complete len:217 (+),score=24.52 GFYU01004538.1:55-705(+)
MAHLVAYVNDVPVRGSKCLNVDGRMVTLFRVSETHYTCVDSLCYHMGGALNEGDIEDIAGRVTVRCPSHGRRVDIRTGEAIESDLEGNWFSQGVKQRTHACFVDFQSGAIYVNLTEPTPGAEVESDRFTSTTSRLQQTRPGAARLQIGGTQLQIGGAAARIRKRFAELDAQKALKQQQQQSQPSAPRTGSAAGAQQSSILQYFHAAPAQEDAMEVN